MAKIKLNRGNLNIEQKLTQSTNIKTAMTGNASFTTPNPTLTSYGTAITTLTTKNAAVVALQGQLKQAMTDRDTAEQALDALTVQLGDYVQNISGGSATIIQSAGMDVKAAKSPAGVPATVMNLALTAGDNAGEVDAQWDPVSGTKTYEVQTSPDPVTATSWTSQPLVTKSKAGILGLTSGSRVWLRVRATNSAGTGAWSDVATKIVP